MNTWMIAYISGGVLLLGIIGFIIFRIIKSRNAKKPKKIDLVTTTELGTCHIQGTTEEFRISFGSIDVGFLVKDGVIVGHRDKSSSEFVMYSFEKAKSG